MKTAIAKKDFVFPENIRQLFGDNGLKSIRRIASLSNFNIDDINIASSAIKDSLSKFLMQTPIGLKQMSAVACFSEAINSIIMWSHYTQNHEGFALEYDFNVLTEVMRTHSYVFPVIYGNIRM